jgi:uncharacterized protein (TIGR02246 family)
MRFVSSLGLLFVLAMLTACTFQTGEGENPVDEKAQLDADLRAIREIHERDIAAVNAGDVETLVSLMTDDIVLLPPGQPPLVGKESARAMIEADLEQGRDFEIVEYVQDWEEVQVVGDYAFEWGTFNSAVQAKAGGETIRQSNNVIRILRRQPDGSWKVCRAIWNTAPTAAEETP